MVIFVVGESWDSPRNSNVGLAKVFFTPLSSNTTILTLYLLKYLQASGAIGLVQEGPIKILKISYLLKAGVLIMCTTLLSTLPLLHRAEQREGGGCRVGDIDEVDQVLCTSLEGFISSFSQKENVHTPVQTGGCC